MNEEIEALYALLGVKPDEASVADSVDKLVKAVQSKLKSSIYGGKDGVITLPATIEGKFKNGKEINKDIKDAYAAIYEQAKKMADESVSLTLDDLKNFKAQIDKFGQKTAKYKGSDVIANANNNLRQTLSDYQDFVNNLRKEVSAQQKAQVKQAQKVKAQQKAKTKKAYHGITDEEIDDAIAKENARQAKIKAWRDKQAEQLASKLGYKSSSGLDPSKTNNYAMNASEFSEYESQWARELAKTIKETYKTTVDKQWIDKEYKPAEGNGRATTREEHLNFLSNAAFKDLADLIAKAEKGDESVTFDKIVEAIGVMRTIYEENGKDMDTIAKAVINATQSRYDDNPRRKNGGTNREEGAEKGVGKGHEQVKAYQSSISQLLKKMLGEVTDIKERENEATKAAVKMTNAYEQAKTDAKNSKASLDTKQLAQELKNSDTTKAELNKLNTSINNVKSEVKAGTKATNTQTVYDKNANVKADTDMAKEIKVNEVNRDINKDTARAVKEDEASGFNTDSLANKLIKITENIYNCLDKGGKTTSKIALPASTKDLYKKLADPSKILGLPKPDGRRKKISNGMKDENPIRALVPIQDAMKKSLAVIPGEFAKTLKESIHPSVLDKQRHIDRPYAKDNFEYDESMLRRLADASNARKEARRRQSGEDNPPPRVIVPDYQPQVEKSKIFASPIKQTVWDKLADAIGKLTGATKEYYDVVNAAAEDQDKMAADRIVKYGLNNGRNPNDTGDIAGMKRILQLYRTNKASIEQNPELKQKIKLTEGRTVDTTAITKALNKVLSGKQMRNAQMGGSPLRQVLGSFTGFIGMPSIEKSRAQADGLNQVLGNITNALNQVLDNIQMKETELAGLEKAGKAKFNADGTLTEDSSSAAFKTLADLEEEKLVLDSIKADLLANDAIIEKTGGKFSKLVKQLSFTSPVLRQNNTVLRNINAGLDKNGKALKYQTRLAEILNYTFQLIGRSIGQWFKKILSMLNPLNIIKNTFKTITGWIKSAFQDFGSYDTKWQRTMNVIKINFQRAIKPAMEWIAQKLVNIIGFFNIISMKVQEAFGQVPVDLFDQAGANAEKMRRELEEAANVTAGFDELHDIGSDNSGANDLMGDIYKPQLSQEWIDMANEIGDLLAGLIKGEKTVGEVFGRIFEMLLDLLGKIAKAIWDWFKQTALGKWITENWKKLLAALLAIYLGWKLLKIAGSLLWKALTGSLTEGAFSGLFGKIGGWITKILGATAFGRGIMEGITSLFTGGGGLLATLKSIFVGHEAITAFGAWGETLGALFAQSLLAVIGVAIAGFSIAKGFDIVADDTSYNLGYEDAGGKNEKDKKTGAGGKVLGTLGGAAGGALAGLAIGGPIGAAIGAVIGGIAGLITTSLAPAFEEAEVAARKMNNELQKIEYYEGQVKGAESVVDDFTEKLNLSNDTVDAQKDKVYKLGEKYGVSKTELDKLVKSIEDGNYQTEMSAGYNDELSTALDQLDWHYRNNKDLSDKLTEAKKKLAKAELDLSIASDIEAGNFELAAARIEYAMASDLYTTDEAAAKMAQIMKETSFTEATELLNNCSPELQKKWNEYTSDIEQGKKDITDIFSKMSESERDNLLKSNNNDLKQKWFTYATTTREGKKELAKMYSEMNDEERRAFEKDYSAEAGGAMSKAIQAMQREINSASWDWSHPFKSLMSTFSGDWSWKAKYASFDVGTNYVPNDGFAYIHKGEAIIPADQNVFADQGKAFSAQSMTNEELVQAIRELKAQMQQGVNVKGQFVQRGTDLVATVEKANNRMSNSVLNNKVYAR